MLFLFISYLNNGGKRLSLLATFLAPLLAITLPFAASAQVSRAIYCASHEDYIEVPHNAALNFTNNFSIECWLKPAATQTDMSANFNNILVKTYNYSGAIPFGFQFLNSGTDAGKLKVIRKNSTGISIANYLSDNRIDDGKFHHIAFVKDSTSSPNLKLYVDGILQGIGVSDIAGTTNNNNSLYLGRSGEAQNPFSGAFDELKIWKNARSAANVLSDMTSVAPSTMIAYYNMETGLKNKGSASSVNGFLGGNAVFFPTQKSYGNALHFDGINDFVNFSTNLGTFTNQMTVDVWIRPESLGGTQIIATQIGKWELKLLAGKPVFSVNTTTGTTFVVSANAALSATQNWYHIAGVFSANGVSNRITLYLNGEIENTITSGTNYAIATAGTGMMLGAKGTTTSAQSYFKGMIDELNVWNTALTADNIVAEMNVGDATANVNHLAYFPFDQGIPSGGNSSQNSLINVFANGNGLLYNFSLSNTSSNWVARAAYLEAPNASLVSGNTYHFEGNISETGTGKLLGNGFLLSNSSINSYPNYANSAVNVAETTLGETTFEKNSLLSPFYKSYVIGTEGVSLSTQSTGPCVTGFPVGNITFSGGSTAVSVSWTAVPNVTSYDWRLIAPDGDLNTPDQKGNLQSNTLLLKGLDPGSRYYFYLRAKCGGGLGEWVGPAFFATTSSPYLNADSLKNDNYIDIDWALPSAYFIQNAANGVHIQLKNGNNILYEQPITDYTPYQGAPQPTFSFVANTNLQQYYAINNTTSWAALNSWTMETWVKMAATNLNSTRLFQNVNGTNPFTVWIDSADKQVKLSLNNVIYSFSAMQLPVEQWFHLAVSYGNGEANLYIEGIFAAKISLPSLQTSGGNFQVLYACNQVAMAELRFWNRVRTAEEIKYNKAVATFSGVIQNNLLLQWKWQAQTVPPTDLATTYDGLNNDGALFQVGGGQILSYNHTTYLATPYYAAIRGTFRHYTGPSASKAYKLNGYQIGSGAIINAIYFPPQDTGKTLAYQPITNLKADSTPFNILLSWKNKSKVSEFFRIRRTAGNGTNSVTLATISGTDKIDSLMTFTDTYSLEDSTIFNNGTAYRYYIDTYSPTFNRIFDSLRYDLVNIPAINVVASDNLFSSKVEITWNNLNSFGYQIRIERDDETLATLNPSLTSYTDLYPIYGKRHRYSVMLLDPATNNALAAGFDRGGVQAKGTISGNAYTNVGDFALKDVKILLTNISNNTKDSTYTDENGQFSFGNVYYGQSGDIVLNAFFLNHKFLNSPRTLSLSNQDYGFTNVIFKDSTTWENDSLNTSFTLSNFVASPLSGQDKVSLTWDYSLTAGDTLKMNVYRGSELIDVLNCTSGTNISIFDSTGKPNYVYNYSLTAYKFEGNTIKTLSRIQENISYPAITSPAAFTAVVSTAQGVVNLAWTHSSRNYNGFKIYRAQQTANPSPPSDTVLIATLENGIFTFKDKQTLAGTSGYKYVIRAYRTVENLTFESAKIISGSINYPPLPVLSVLTATPTPARNSMSFTWTLPANSPLNDTAYNYDGYVIYRKKNTPANSPYQLVGAFINISPKTLRIKRACQVFLIPIK